MKFDQNGWLDEAIEIDYSAKSMSREGHKVTHVCMHGTAGGSSAQGIANYFATSDVQASAHIIIDQAGNIAQGISTHDAAWGNGIITAGHAPFIREDINPNFYTVSIECVKSATDNSNALTDIQRQKSFEVVDALCDYHGIPRRAGDINGGIIRHADIDPVNRARCPGPYDFNGLFDYLNSGQEELIMIDLSNPTVASHFVPAPNGAWHCPSTNATIGGEILATYQKFGGDGLCGLTHWGLPLTPELPTGKSGTVFQRFERVTVAFDPNHTIDSPPGAGRVYEMHIDSGIGQDPRVTDLAAHIADLQKQLAAMQPAALAQENTALKSKIVQGIKVLQG